MQTIHFLTDQKVQDKGSIAQDARNIRSYLKPRTPEAHRVISNTGPQACLRNLFPQNHTNRNISLAAAFASAENHRKNADFNCANGLYTYAKTATTAF
eukprot:g5853.t1